AVLTTLHGMSSGGIYDHLAGGFARYSVDDKWLVPHFEKMLSDNGQILSLMVRAWNDGRQPLLRARIGETANWMMREMQLPEGGFAASLDADTGHEEGLTYVWTKAEIDDALGEEAEFFCTVYDVTDAGNWEGKTILNRLSQDRPAYLDTETEDRLSRLKGRLLANRDGRPQPDRDGKVLADWNAVAIAGLAEASRATGDATFLEAAQEAFRFICGSMQQDDRLCHSWCDGRITSAGLATDYAQMAHAAIALHSVTGTLDYLSHAVKWFDQLNKYYIDSGTVYLTATDSDDLIVRPVGASDEAMPSAAGIILQLASQLFAITAEPDYRSSADAILAAHAEQMSRDIIGAASLHSGFDNLLRSRLAYVATSDPKQHMELSDLILAEADPALLLINGAADETAIPKPVPQAAAGKNGLYLCVADRCRPPVSNLQEARKILAETRNPIQTS
ncbi:MAG TPA: thioredoxin domain-containing protein, partial [Afifellaceae bacterium]|nr:thioredoxin domain-containing protein [Afifellaceae bacterium]